ncbi:isoform b [Stylonychia lemnae]|uniref:Isoform b n=1 Tax=Stylonychia lemnae TaxID=5949 RepID=A0A078AY56_STYLE|nr:isoform b [Stylonychia lemnae]|eukprot:CDW85723.1 isoform b [Stylonychia lemnae]
MDSPNNSMTIPLKPEDQEIQMLVMSKLMPHEYLEIRRRPRAQSLSGGGNGRNGGLLREYLLSSRYDGNIPEGSKQYKLIWFVLLYYMSFYLICTFSSLIIKGVANANSETMPPEVAQKCPMNLNKWYSVQQILFALAPFPIYYSVKLIIRDRQIHYLYKERLDRNGNIRRTFIFSTVGIGSKIVLGFLDILHLVQSITATANYLNNREDILEYCAPYNPVMNFMLLFYTSIGLLSFPRFIILIYFFVWRVRGLNVNQARMSANETEPQIQSFKFPIIKYENLESEIRQFSAISQPNQTQEITEEEKDNENQFLESTSPPRLLQKQIKYNDNRIDNQNKRISKDEIISDSCPICCEAFGNSDKISFLPCNIKHIYHTNCIQMWLGKHNTCPLCKHEVIKVSYR